MKKAMLMLVILGLALGITINLTAAKHKSDQVRFRTYSLNNPWNPEPLTDPNESFACGNIGVYYKFPFTGRHSEADDIYWCSTSCEDGRLLVCTDNLGGKNNSVLTCMAENSLDAIHRQGVIIPLHGQDTLKLRLESVDPNFDIRINNTPSLRATFRVYEIVEQNAIPAFRDFLLDPELSAHYDESGLVEFAVQRVGWVKLGKKLAEEGMCSARDIGPGYILEIPLSKNTNAKAALITMNIYPYHTATVSFTVQ